MAGRTYPAGLHEGCLVHRHVPCGAPPGRVVVWYSGEELRPAAPPCPGEPEAADHPDATADQPEPATGQPGAAGEPSEAGEPTGAAEAGAGPDRSTGTAGPVPGRIIELTRPGRGIGIGIGMPPD